MRKLLLLALLCATSASSYLLQAQNNQSTENIKTDSLQPLVIEEINKRIINEYNSIIRHTKRRNYNKIRRKQFKNNFSILSKLNTKTLQKRIEDLLNFIYNKIKIKICKNN